MTLRSNKPKGALLATGFLWVGLLLAAPLAAQDPVGTIRVESPAVTVEGDSIFITNEITVMPDSVRLARIAVALEDIGLQIAEQECNTCGGSNLVRVGQGALVLIAAFMAWQVKKIADRPADSHTTNVDVDYEHPDHDRRKRDDDHGESE